MSEPDDITTPGDGTDDVLEGPPRESDVDGDIDKSKKRAWLIGAGALLLVVALILGVVVLGGGGDADDTSDVAGDSSTEASGAVPPSEVPTSSYMDTSTVDGTGFDDGDNDPSDHPGDGGTDDPDDGPGQPVDAGMVAYRLGDEVWVAAGDGTEQRYVTDLPEGIFELSPDGMTLATISPATWDLRLVQVDSGSYISLGHADLSVLAWSPDSRRLLFSSGAGDARVYDVRTDQSRSVALHQAAGEPKFGPDSGAIALAVGDANGHTPPHFVVTYLDGGTDSYGAVSPLADFAWHDDLVCYSVRPGQDRPVEIRYAYLAGSSGTPYGDISGERLVKPPHGVGFMVGYTRLMLSPDGSMLAYAASGDDGFSRMYVVDANGGEPTELTIRRDAYPVRWSHDGEYLLFIEGNAFQGEETRLMRVRPDGLGRETLIEGAGL